MKLTFKWNEDRDQIAYDRSGGKDGRLFLANEMKRLMDPYVPANNLVLAQNVRTYVSGEDGIVHYLSPYAHYQYKGILYVSSLNGSAWASKGEYKVPAEPEKKLEHSKFRHPLATSEWDKAMWTARRNDIMRSYQAWLKTHRV